jgi:hypothetical protein
MFLMLYHFRLFWQIPLNDVNYGAGQAVVTCFQKLTYRMLQCMRGFERIPQSGSHIALQFPWTEQVGCRFYDNLLVRSACSIVISSIAIESIVYCLAARPCCYLVHAPLLSPVLLSSLSCIVSQHAFVATWCMHHCYRQYCYRVCRVFSRNTSLLLSGACTIVIANIAI